MSARRAARAAFWLAAPGLALCLASFYLNLANWKPAYSDLAARPKVYAYRQWQSSGLKLASGDQLRLRARGQWSYSPQVGLHGPEGGLPAAANYPLPDYPGGALLGRIGDNGPAFYVGRQTMVFAETPGVLYLRINDDLLGDNSGEMEIEVTKVANGEESGR